MGSVRDRIERELREAPEQSAPQGTRRVALTSGSTMSTRQQADFAAAQDEVIVRPTRTTSAASVEFEVGGFSRVRDRQIVRENIPEAERPKTSHEVAVDMHQQWVASAEQERQRLDRLRTEAQQKREADAKAIADAHAARRTAAELNQRKAQHEFLENAVLREADGLTPEETQVFWDRLIAMNAGLDAGAASIVAESIRLARKDLGGI